jgi:hypothetical protein
MRGETRSCKNAKVVLQDYGENQACFCATGRKPISKVDPASRVKERFSLCLQSCGNICDWTFGVALSSDGIITIVCH